MARKLKALDWNEVACLRASDKYVPADLARGLLDALDEAQRYIMHKGKRIGEFEIVCMIDAAIAAATEEVEEAKPESLGDFLLNAMKLQAPTEEE